MTTLHPESIPGDDVRRDVLLHHREAAVRELVGLYDKGSEVQAVLDVARIVGVAVAWEDRQSIEGMIGRDLTDEEWTLIAPGLEDMDEAVNRDMGRDLVIDFVHQVMRDAGVDPHVDPDGDGPTQVPPRTCEGCGCTDERTCAGGCAWATATRCTACAGASVTPIVLTDEGYRADDGPMMDTPRILGGDSSPPPGGTT